MKRKEKRRVLSYQRKTSTNFMFIRGNRNSRLSRSCPPTHTVCCPLHAHAISFFALSLSLFNFSQINQRQKLWGRYQADETCERLLLTCLTLSNAHRDTCHHHHHLSFFTPFLSFSYLFDLISMDKQSLRRTAENASDYVYD